FQAEDGIRDRNVTGVQTCALPISKSYWGSKSKHFKMAKQAVMKSGNYAFAGRKLKKRDYRRLWITRLSSAVAPYGLNYSTFMNRSEERRVGKDCNERKWGSPHRNK